MSCEICRSLLNEALNLSVRARKLDASQRSVDELNASVNPDNWPAKAFDRHVARHNARHPLIPMAPHNGCIVHPWVEEQYASDLADWESRARKHLSGMCEEESE